MVKVIKNGKVNQVTCDACSAVLEYMSTDVELHHGHYAEKKSFYKYITCPCCKNHVIIETK